VRAVRDHVLAEGLDRFAKLDLAAVELDVEGGLQRFGDVA
jgi:hypothetical protein